jgi:hypothetical protein
VHLAEIIVHFVEARVVFAQAGRSKCLQIALRNEFIIHILPFIRPNINGFSTHGQKFSDGQQICFFVFEHVEQHIFHIFALVLVARTENLLKTSTR